MTSGLVRWNRILGPGILVAAAAVGTSHLVQSTRAGADFGFQLLWLVLLINLVKYPFFEFGQRYGAAAKETMLHGYAKLGRGYLLTFLAVSFITMLLSITVLAFVTGALAANLLQTLLPDVAWIQKITTGSTWTLLIWSVSMAVACEVILISGRYAVLDRAVKAIMALLAMSAVIAFVVAVARPSAQAAEFVAQSPWRWEHFAFLIAVMGWMPGPVELSVWPSVWMDERSRQDGFRPSVREALVDMNAGYIGAVILAVMFLGLGALMMYPLGEDFPDNAVQFCSRIVQLFTDSVGAWVGPVIAIAAFTTLFSTTLTCLDGYPRSNAVAMALLRGDRSEHAAARLFMVFNLLTMAVLIGAIAVIVFAFDAARIQVLVDVATIIAFLTAPIFGFLNLKLIRSEYMPGEHRPGSLLMGLAWIGLAFLVVVSIAFLIWRIATWVV